VLLILIIDDKLKKDYCICYYIIYFAYKINYIVNHSRLFYFIGATNSIVYIGDDTAFASVMILNTPN
jgi:hypothetical protein